MNAQATAATTTNESILTTPNQSNKSLKTPSYAAMVMEAVITLNEKHGSSLNAIRKFILNKYNLKKQHTASFHNLTLKAVNRCVASDELERIKHSFRLSATEIKKRNELEKARLRASGVDVLVSFYCMITI